MELIYSQYMAYLLYGLILAMTCAQMLVVYSLSDSSNPPRGLSLFTVYFMAALMGWILLTLQYGPSDTHITLDVPAITMVATSYILYIASGQRANVRRGRYVLGIVGLGACLSAFFLRPTPMFIVELVATGLFWSLAGGINAWSAWKRRNVGDGIISAGAAAMVIGLISAALYYWRSGASLDQAHTLGLAIYCIAYTLVIVGFLASVLVEYQQNLSHLATEDPLTQLLNRRGLEEAIFVTLAGTARHYTQTSAIMVDIDHFKQLNESFGEDIGDRILQKVAERLLSCCRTSDVIARIGGEEFLIVMPSTDLDAAHALAERIRLAVAGQPLKVEGNEINIGVSLGVTTAEGEVQLEDFYQATERALNTAKRNGRNRVAVVDNRHPDYNSRQVATKKAS